LSSSFFACSEFTARLDLLRLDESCVTFSIHPLFSFQRPADPIRDTLTV